MFHHRRNRRALGGLIACLMGLSGGSLAWDRVTADAATKPAEAPVAAASAPAPSALPLPLPSSSAPVPEPAAAAPSTSALPTREAVAPGTATAQAPVAPSASAVVPPSAAPTRAPSSSAAPKTTTAAGVLTGAAEGRAYPFGTRNVFRTDISSAPVAAGSAAKVGLLASTVSDRYGGVAAFNVHQYNVNYYVAPAGTPKVDLAFNDCQGKGEVPAGLTGPGGQFTGVPIPAAAVSAGGEDKELTIYSPETDTLWEFWVANRDASGRWSACWGGRLDAVSTSYGFFSDGFGASASGLAIAAGMVGLADVRAGRIDHALTLAIPGPAAWPAMSWPAQRSDGGNTDPNAIPEGTRLRLDPSVDVDSLGLHPVAAMVAKAAQQYGFIVTDQSGAVSVSTESGAAEAAVTGVDPWEGILGGTPDYLVMQHFPWHSLQVLPADHGKP